MKHINIILGIAALAISAGFSSCSHDFGDWTPTDEVNDTYNRMFVETFGQPAANHNWGFDQQTRAAGSRITRSQTTPAVATMTAPYDEAWVTTYNQTAQEPNSTNIIYNYDNSSYARKQGTYVEPYTTWYAEFQTLYPEANYGWNWNQAVAAAKADGWAHFDDLFVYNPDTNYVLNFKITGTWNGGISVAGSEGMIDGGTLSHAERTIVVTGTWNITEDQRIGSLGKIIIADGGTVNVAEGKRLNMVNQAQLVVLHGGLLTGKGTVEVNNGNEAGRENYNGGTIDVAVFNNNFGKFFNYGKFLVTEYRGGAKESNFYNHSLVHIKHTQLGSETPNARIFNACQWYCEGDMRCRNYEGIMGSAFIVGGQLMVSTSEDGTTDPTYFALAAGALVKAGTLYNNGTSWTGPTEGGYAVLSIGQFDHMNWEQDHPEQGGYFINNIYLQADNLSNVPTGNGYHQTDPTDEYNYSLSIAEYKFKNIVANAGGNGNVRVIEKGETEIIPADTDFELGVKGCTPGFKGNTTPPEEDEWGEWVRIIVEDLSVQTRTDFDFNDAVFDVRINSTKTKAQIKLKAAGGTLPLTIGWTGDAGTNYEEYEVHNMYNVATNVMVNTNARNGVDGKADVTKTLTGTFNSANDVKVMVQKRGEWMEITAHTGQPASKIQVKTTYTWCQERKNISDIYNGTVYEKSFNDYVSDPSVASDWYEFPSE